MNCLRGQMGLCVHEGGEKKEGRGRRAEVGRTKGGRTGRVGGRLVLPVIVLALGTPRMNERRAPSGEGMNEMAKVSCVRGRGQEGRRSQ